MIDIAEADIIARGDEVSSLINSQVWRKYLQPWLADYIEILRNQLMTRAGAEEGVSPHYAAFLAGQERMINVLITQLSEWRKEGEEIKQKGGDD